MKQGYDRIYPADLRTTNFSLRELRCHCDRCKREQPHYLVPAALDALQRVRDKFYQQTGRVIVLSSAYRCYDHPEEVKKREKYGADYKGGRHHKGTAFDIRVGWGRDRQLLITLLTEEGFDAYGYANTFLHADWGRGYFTSWSYD